LHGKANANLPVAQALRSYYTYRGTTCYLYDYMQPVTEAHNAVLAALKHYNAISVTIDTGLAQKIFNWVAPALTRMTRNVIDPIIKKWEEHHMFYIVTVYHIPRDGMGDIGKPSLKVHITSPTEDKNAISGYDLVVDGADTPEKIALEIGEYLHKSMFAGMAQPGEALIKDESSENSDGILLEALSDTVITDNEA
jgi:hypothetical protein